jgi:fucose permease
VGLIWLGYGVVISLIRQESKPAQAQGRGPRLNLGMLRDRPFLMLFLIAFIYNGVAVSLLGWIGVFMQRSGDVSNFFSLSMISIFYVALTTGRFLCALVVERLGYTMMMRLLALGLLLTYPLVLIGGETFLMVAGVFCIGLSFSGLFPTALAFGTRLYPEQAGTLTGTLGVGMTLGSMIPPVWTGLIADRWNFQMALGVNYLLVVALMGIVLYLSRLESRSAAGQPAGAS